MEPVIELRSEMRVRPRYRLGLFLIATPWLLIGLGYWLGSPTLVSSELNRQEAYDVSIDVFRECDKQFIPEGKPEYITQAANVKCQKIQGIALDSGWNRREKKK